MAPSKTDLVLREDSPEGYLQRSTGCLSVFDRIPVIYTNPFLKGDLAEIVKLLPTRVNRRSLTASFDLEIPVNINMEKLLINLKNELRPTHGFVYHYSPFGGFLDQDLNRPYSLFTDDMFLTIQTAHEVYGHLLLNRVNDILQLVVNSSKNHEYK